MSNLKKLCLNMIVKDEAENLPKLFKSLHKVIDYYVICDTGSTDNTVQVIKDEMNKYGVQGDVYQDKWVNFGHNRQLALDRAVGKAKYILIIDADETLEYTDESFADKLTHSCYNINRKISELVYHCKGVVSLEDNNKFGWKWYEPLHEYLINSSYTNFTSSELPDVNILSPPGMGARSKGVSQEEKFLKDAKVFEDDLIKNPNNDRSMFYLAQSYRDANEPEKSIECYRKRIAMGGWIEEVYISYLKIAGQLQTMGRPYEVWAPEYLNAYNKLPTRMEALYYLVEYNRLNGNYNLGYLYGKMGARLTKNNNSLFIVNSIYSYGMYDSYSVCAYWAGDYEECAYFCQKLLDEKKIPESSVPRIKQNLQYALAKLNPGSGEVNTDLDVSTSVDVVPDKTEDNFEFYKGYDSFGSDITYEPNKTVDELKELCNANKDCIGFNTLGWLKSNICSKNRFIKPSVYSDTDGLYVDFKKLNR